MATFSEEFLRIKLLHRKRAVVTQNGIRLNGLYYTCKHAEQEQWFVRAGAKRFPINVSYDRRTTNQIYIYDLKDPRKYHKAELTPASRPFADLSHAEAAATIQIRKLHKRHADEHNLHLEFDFEQRRSERARHSHDETQAAITASRGVSRMSKGKDIRQVEARDRQQDAVEYEEIAARPTGTSDEVSGTQTKRGARIPKPASASAPASPQRKSPATAGNYAISNPLAALLGSNDD
jgi:putative transposase